MSVSLPRKNSSFEALRNLRSLRNSVDLTDTCIALSSMMQVAIASDCNRRLKMQESGKLRLSVQQAKVQTMYIKQAL